MIFQKTDSITYTMNLVFEGSDITAMIIIDPSQGLISVISLGNQFTAQWADKKAWGVPTFQEFLYGHPTQRILSTLLGSGALEVDVEKTVTALYNSAPHLMASIDLLQRRILTIGADAVFESDSPHIKELASHFDGELMDWVMFRQTKFSRLMHTVVFPAIKVDLKPAQVVEDQLDLSLS